MATKPELLDQDTTVDDNDLIMKTDSLNVTKTIKGGNLFTWIWNKIKAKILSNEITLHAVDEAKPYYPVDSTAVIHSAISTMDVNNPAPINSAALNGALAGLIKITYINKVTSTTVDISSLGSGKYLAITNLLQATFAGYSIGILEVLNDWQGRQSQLNVFSYRGITNFSSSGELTLNVPEYANGIYVLPLM